MSAKSISKSWIVSAVLASATGCVNIIYPEKEWYESPDLELESNAFAGARLSVHCARGRVGDERAATTRLRACDDLARNLGKRGAIAAVTREDEENPPSLPLFDVIYIEQGEEIDVGFFNIIGTVLTFGTLPLLVEREAHASLQLKDQRGQIVRQHEYKLQSASLYGWPVMYLWLTQKLSQGLSYIDTESYYQRVPQQLLNHMINAVYTQYVRLQSQGLVAAVDTETAKE